MIRFIFTSIIALLIIGLLIWQHFNGGVPSHHILQQKDLPEISNWWGAVLLPILAWILSGRIEKRITKQGTTIQSHSMKIIGLFIAGLLLGILIVFAFTNNNKPFLDNVPYVFLLLSLFIPIFYSEFIFGFILGMAYTFGAILPTIFILLFALIGFLIYRFINPQILKIKKMIFGQSQI
jgi:uncharacterized protein YacL